MPENTFVTCGFLAGSRALCEMRMRSRLFAANTGAAADAPGRRFRCARRFFPGFNFRAKPRTFSLLERGKTEGLPAISLGNTFLILPGRGAPSLSENTSQKETSQAGRVGRRRTRGAEPRIVWEWSDGCGQAAGRRKEQEQEKGRRRRASYRQRQLIPSEPRRVKYSDCCIQVCEVTRSTKGRFYGYQRPIRKAGL